MRLAVTFMTITRALYNAHVVYCYQFSGVFVYRYADFVQHTQTAHNKPNRVFSESLIRVEPARTLKVHETLFPL